jgi:leader peptidase (prepilin peptidase)/N-methyltransferase
MEKLVLYAYFSFVFLFIGSFLNVVAFRTLEGTTVWNPKHSHCPACQTRLGWKDLMPVLSWLFLQGRCRTCGSPISWLYPLGELGTALVLMFVLFRGGLTWETLVIELLFSFILVLTLTDLKSKLMPNKITYPGIALMFLLRLWVHPLPMADYLLGALVGGGVVFLLAVLTNGMGGGDVKMFALIGMALGVKGVLLAFFFACLWGTLIGLPLKWTGRIKPRQPVPFGPYILLGTLTAWGYGNKLWEAYLSLFV